MHPFVLSEVALTIDHLALYSRKCKTCRHLDPEEKVAYEECHHSRGNTECPAKEVQFAVVGMARRFAEEVKKARKASDLARERAVLESVEKRSLAFQQKFRDWLTK